MSSDDRIRWDQRYRDGAYGTRTHPSAFLLERLPWIEHGRGPARALDLACGRGRNALYLATRGFQVDAVDISSEALRQGQEAAAQDGVAHLIRWHQHDLDEGLVDSEKNQASGLLQGQAYDLTLIMRYLDLSLLPAAAERLQPGGHLLCEVHLHTDQQVHGPRSPEFRARSGEVRQAASGLQILLYEEGLVQDPDGETVCLARLHACRQA